MTELTKYNALLKLEKKLIAKQTRKRYRERMSNLARNNIALTIELYERQKHIDHLEELLSFFTSVEKSEREQPERVK